MAILIPVTFGTTTDTPYGRAVDKDEKAVLVRVTKALENITGLKGVEIQKGKVKNPQDGSLTWGIDYHNIAATGTLFKLRPYEDRLRASYMLLWYKCTVEFDENEPGAEILPQDNRIILGPFMFGLNVVDTEKIIIHEFLHVALDDDWQTGKPFGPMAQHQQINPIIKRRLGYRDPVNPSNPAEQG